MKYILTLIFSINFFYSQCNPLEVAVFLSEKDGWMFPYSTFYQGMSDGVYEINTTNPDCAQLLEDNNQCIYDCISLTEDETDEYLGRVGCIYYNCPDGDALTQNYEELSERPIHLYGQYYCDESTIWNEDTDLCHSEICNGDLNGDSIKNVQDVVQMVQGILNGDDSCED